MKDWLAYELARPAEVERVRAAAPVAYLPWGALEWHSYHNPLGVDGLKARGICEALAARTGGVVLPPVYVGTDTIKSSHGFAHSIEHRRETVHALAIEYLEQLIEEQFRVLVVIAGHYGHWQTETLRTACDEVAALHPEVRVWFFPDWEPNEAAGFEANHAALGETSYMMLFHPDTVDLDMLPTDRVTDLDRDGVHGSDPRASDAGHGRAMLDSLVSSCVPRIGELLAEVRDA